MTRALRVATRGSRLAMWQTGHVVSRLREAEPSLDVEIVEIATRGDVIQDVPLSRVGSTAIFTREIESALLEDRADLAVHSLKDLASSDVPGLSLISVLEREDPRDALVSARGDTLEALPAGSRIGTSSVRRKAILRACRPDLEILDLRGNVPTRVGRLDEGRYDAIVLAAAGLLRLGLADRITELLEPDIFVPAAGQGAIALQMRADDGHRMPVVEGLQHDETRVRVDAERAFLRELRVGCQAPVGAHARIVSDRLELTVRVLALDGSRSIDRTLTGEVGEPGLLGRRAADVVRADGAVELLEAARRAGEAQ